MMRTDSRNGSKPPDVRVTAVPLLGMLIFGIGLVWRGGDRPVALPLSLGVALTPLVLAFLGWRTWRTWWPPLDRTLRAHGEAVDRLGTARLGTWIALAAGLGLFLELLIIRLHASFFQFFAYFKNISLLSCFLGLGAGYLLAGRVRLWTPVVLPLLAAQVTLLHALRAASAAPFLQNPVVEQLTLGMEHFGEWVDLVTVYGFLVFAFSLNALTFVPLGQLAGRLMRRQDKLRAYGANLLGSLAGIAVFDLLAAWWTPPTVWLAVGAIGMLLFLRGPRAVMVTSMVAALLTLGALSISGRLTTLDTYSPYQILTLTQTESGEPELLVNNVYFQHILDLRRDANGEAAPQTHHYELPYAFRPHPGRVLVVGAGTGNDVAAAVRAGSGTIDAVEIDPAILRYGRLLHPEHPYDAPSVNAVVDDARAFIRHTDETYDLIVYGLLDSHTLLSGRAGVRLDSYVYTVEAFREARARLGDDGLIVMTFSVMGKALAAKLEGMLTEAFDGQRPLALHIQNFGVSYVIGEGLGADTLAAPPGFPPAFPEAVRPPYDPSTDDWPFLYMPERRYPSTYLAMVLLLLMVSMLVIRGLAPGVSGAFSPPCFFLGAGFMLVETKAITELALAYGSTWQVVAITIGAILAMAWAANAIVLKRGAPPLVPTYLCLGAAVAAGLFLPALALEHLPAGVGGAVAALVLTVPLFFSGFAFSRELARARGVGEAMASNLLGAMLGGLLEYNAMMFGLRALYLIALALYALAFVTARRAPGAK